MENQIIYIENDSLLILPKTFKTFFVNINKKYF